MKVQALLVVVLWIACGPHICFSQNSKPRSSSQKIEAPLTDARIMPSRLDSVHNALVHAKTHEERADISFQISRYYADRLKIDSALFYSEKIKQESTASNYELGMAQYYIARSHALFFRSTREPENMAKAIEILKHHKDDALSGFAYRVMGRQDLQAHNFIGARKNLHASISYFTRAGRTLSLQFVYYELGNTFSYVFEKDSAAYYLITSLQLAEKINEHSRIFTSAGALGDMYHATGDLPNAARYLKYSLDHRTADIGRILERNLLGSYTNVLLEQGEFMKAEPVMNEYETTNGKIGDTWGLIMSNNIKGKYNFHKKNYPEALRLLRLAYQEMIKERRISTEMRGIAYYLGRTEYSISEYDSAIQHFTFTGELDRALQIDANKPDINLYIAQAYEKKGDKDAALRHFRIYDQLKDSLYTFSKEKAVIELTTKYETEKKEQQIQLLQREKELNIYQLRAKNDQIEKQQLIDAQRSQQLAILSQQSEIDRLAASEKSLAFDNQQKEMIKKQNELALLTKENELQTAVAAKETQRTKFSYIAIAAILLFSGYIYYRSVQNKKVGRRLAISLAELKEAQEQLIKTEKEKEAENIRVRISRDIHDEVGATLSGVALFSEIAREKMKQQKGDDAQVYLDHITVNSKEMVDKMSDIVWAINPENDSFERIFAKLQSYAFNLCAGKGITLHTNIDDEIKEHYPPMHAKRNLYLFMKEAINNAVKYSEGKNIYLSLQKTGDHILAGIKDDGKGFDKEIRHEGNGLNNLKARASSLNGDLVIDSQAGKGTNIRLEFNFHPTGGHRELV